MNNIDLRNKRAIIHPTVPISPATRTVRDACTSSPLGDIDAFRRTDAPSSAILFYPAHLDKHVAALTPVHTLEVVPRCWCTVRRVLRRRNATTPGLNSYSLPDKTFTPAGHRRDWDGKWAMRVSTHGKWELLWDRDWIPRAKEATCAEISAVIHRFLHPSTSAGLRTDCLSSSTADSCDLWIKKEINDPPVKFVLFSCTYLVLKAVWIDVRIYLRFYVF